MRRGFIVLGALAALVLVGVVALLLGSCVRDATVADIQRSPDSYYGSVVHIEGVASNASPAIEGFAVYELDDGTGRVWVVTRTTPPTGSTKVSVTGRVNKPVALGELTLETHVVEEKRVAVSQ